MIFETGLDCDKDTYVINFETKDREMFLKARKGLICGIERALADELEQMEEEKE